MSRYVIRNAAGVFYTGNAVRAEYITHPTDPLRNVERFRITPEFNSVQVLYSALKYDTPADAHAHLEHADLDDAAAFAGCEVLECEFDKDLPNAVRAIQP